MKNVQGWKLSTITPFAVHYEKIRIYLRKMATNCAKIHECDKKAKNVIESELSANACVLALMNVSSRNWSPFYANGCVFSHNERQKV